MTRRALTFANGAALRAEARARRARACIETKTTTLSLARHRDPRPTPAPAPPIRLLTVSRIDPRKGLRVLPEAVARAGRPRGLDVTLDIVGPTIGLIGDDERDAIRARGRAARRRAIACTCAGPVALDQLMPLYRDYDVFVLPTLPGEGHSARAAGSDGRRACRSSRPRVGHRAA